jgi:DNA-binding NarL/FixJ family response regulator
MIIMIRTILFDDKEPLRKSLATYFKHSEKVYLAASFANATNAVKEVKKINPDVVLMDIEMPFVSGIEALQAIKEACPNTKVMMLTVFDQDNKIFASLRNGALGYALKNFEQHDEVDKLEQGIIDVNNGGGYFSPEIAAKVIRAFQEDVQKPHYVALTDRQIEVLNCMVKGMSRKMISDTLSITVDTVGDHIKEIYRKLHVNSASEAVREAIVRKII